MRSHPLLRRLVALACLGVLPLVPAALEAAEAQQAPPEFRAINLPIQPDLRSVERFLLQPDGLYGVTLGDSGEISYFRLPPGSDKAVRVTALPEGIVEPREIVDHDSGFTWDPTGRAAYSLSPTGVLLRHVGQGSQRTTEPLGQVSGTRPFEDKGNAAVEGYQRSRAMFFDAQGNLYTAGKEGFLFRYSHATGKLERLEARLPAVRGREPWASLDAAALGPDGLVYGGTFDGYIFSLDLKSLRVVNFGKPLRQQRIPGLAFHDGKLYGIGGEEEGLPRTFVFDITTRGFTLGGPLNTPAVPGSAAHSLESFAAPGLVVDPQGRIFLGTTGRLGNLYRWSPSMRAR